MKLLSARRGNGKRLLRRAVNGSWAQLTGKPGASGAKAAGGPALPSASLPARAREAISLFPGAFLLSG